jgi:hypothetical protein
MKQEELEALERELDQKEREVVSFKEKIENKRLEIQALA